MEFNYKNMCRGSIVYDISLGSIELTIGVEEVSHSKSHDPWHLDTISLTVTVI